MPTISAMILECLKTTPDRMGRYWASFEDGSRLGLYRQTVEDYGLYSGRELTDAEWASLREAASRMSARMRAVRIVSMTNVSTRDLRDRLVQKGEDPGQAEQAVAWMRQMDLLDDRATAENLVRACAAKGYGLARAKQALYEKRIPKELWEDALENYPDQEEAIRSFLSARLADPSDPKQVKRAVDALIRRGHGYGEIRRVLNEFNGEDF